MNKFWLKERQIVCEADDGLTDFESGLVVNESALEKGFKQRYEQLDWS